MGTAIHIEAFSTNDKEEVLGLIKAAGLPTEDLTDEKMKNFLVARTKDDSILGVVGVELYQESGLLRSLAVDPDSREKGVGSRLTRKIESLARHKGIKTLYLLTMTAADFFSKMDYKMIQREKVPRSIEKTEEFKNICPVSAACLFKILDSS